MKLITKKIYIYVKCKLIYQKNILSDLIKLSI